MPQLRVNVHHGKEKQTMVLNHGVNTGSTVHALARIVHETMVELSKQPKSAFQTSVAQLFTTTLYDRLFESLQSPGRVYWDDTPVRIFNVYLPPSASLVLSPPKPSPTGKPVSQHRPEWKIKWSK